MALAPIDLFQMDPAPNDIPALLDAIREQDLGKAHALLRPTSVLPDICARV